MKYEIEIPEDFFKIKATQESIVRIMLRDEYERDIQSIKDYQKELNSLPKGKPSYVRRNRCIYIYFFYYENHKMKFKYIGKATNKNIKKIKQIVKLRKYYQDIINRLEFEKKEIELYLKIGDKLYG